MIGGTDVPSQYVSLVQQAASATGLPASVVAAQIQEESSFQPGAVSSAGAEGMFQFLPSTYTEYGGQSGTEDDPADEVSAYIKYMSTLLKQNNGDILKALNAYNGAQTIDGSPNPYGPTILANAGVSTGATSGTGTGATGTGTGTTTQTTSSGATTLSLSTLIGGFTEMSTLIYDFAKILNFGFNMFKPGQGWRVVFGLSALACLYITFRLWIPSRGGAASVLPAAMAAA